jgi:heme A synthase
MAATKSQGKSFTLFIVGVTAAAAGIAYFSSGMGKLALIGGLIVLALAFGIFLKIKPDEGAIADKGQPAAMRMAGVVAAIFGWVIVVFGLNLSTSVSGRMTTTLIGIAVSLVGSLVLLPIAANKNAIWKA